MYARLAIALSFLLFASTGSSEEKYQKKLQTIDGMYINLEMAERSIGILYNWQTEYFQYAETVIVKRNGLIDRLENAKRGDRVIATLDTTSKLIIRLSFMSKGESLPPNTDDNSRRPPTLKSKLKREEDKRPADNAEPDAKLKDADVENAPRTGRSSARTKANTEPRTEARSGYRSGSSESDRSSGASNDREDGNPIVGQTATGKPIHEGPRGGHYHYTKSGNKSYERKKK